MDEDFDVGSEVPNFVMPTMVPITTTSSPSSGFDWFASNYEGDTSAQQDASDWFAGNYEGDGGYKTQVFDDGSSIVIDTSTGNIVGGTDADEGAYPTGGISISRQVSDLASKVGKTVFDALKSAYTNKDNEVDWKSVLATAGGLYGLYQGLNPTPPQPVGYQGKIPEYEAVRQTVQPQYDPTRRPGSGGMRYFSDTTFAKPSEVTAARTAAQEQAAGLAALNRQNPANQPTPTGIAAAQGAQSADAREGRPASQVIQDRPVPQFAEGGIARFLSGGSDGMADKIKANIDGKQEARLSHGEFVIPADVVSHLGNGNSEAGANRLYDMMDRIRKARTGTTRQGRQINPNKFMPK